MTGPTIVVVEDDVRLGESWRFLLRLWGYRIRSFASAEAALAAPLDLLRAGALLTDYRLGGMDGVELVQRARRLRPHLPAALITGAAADEIPPILVERQHLWVFRKPVELDRLEEYLANVHAVAEREPLQVL